MNWTIWLALWFLAGFIGFIVTCVYDMRGEDFDEDYFSKWLISSMLILIIFGGLSLFTALMVVIFTNEHIIKFIDRITDMSPKKRFVKLLYKVANIGIKKN